MFVMCSLLGFFSFSLCFFVFLSCLLGFFFFFFFQAEDGIRDRNVTGVQTCALPILREHSTEGQGPRAGRAVPEHRRRDELRERGLRIGRVLCECLQDRDLSGLRLGVTGRGSRREGAGSIAQTRELSLLRTDRRLERGE